MSAHLTLIGRPRFAGRPGSSGMPLELFRRGFLEFDREAFALFNRAFDVATLFDAFSDPKLLSELGSEFAVSLR